jgi:hypothetical protein
MNLFAGNGPRGTTTASEGHSDTVRKQPMTESKKLTVLREKLIRNRRAIVERLLSASVEQLNSDDLPRVQDAINAVDEAIADEQEAEFRP